MAEKANSAALPDILVVGIAGGSGGGKTTLTTNLIRRFGDKVCIVHHDNYYRAHDDLTYEERTRLNYDCPEAFETEMMIEHLRLLKQGRSVHCPVYDFKVHNRSGETIEIEDGESTRDAGWQLVCVDGYPLGWGKLIRGTLRNKYFSGWRMNA